MTATEASRNFSAVLDAVEDGETITITRGNARVATIGPAPKASARAVLEKLGAWGGELDDSFETDIRSALDMLDHEIKDPWEEN